MYNCSIFLFRQNNLSYCTQFVSWSKKKLLKNSLLNSYIVCIKLYLIIVDDILYTLYLYMMFFDSPWSMSQNLVDLIESSQLGFHGGIFIVDNLRLQFSLMNIQKLHARMSSHCLKEKYGRGYISIFKVLCSRWIDPRKFVLIFS